jgi:protein-disulfide isomerase
VPLLDQVLETYPDKVKIAFKNFPLRNHNNAMNAATAALAARDQGKFWEFHDMLFKNYNKLTDKMISDIAVVLNLDRQKYEQARKAPEIINRISRDMNDGQKAGVRGTPVIFINGRTLRDRSLNGFKQMIDDELKKTG